MKILLAPDKFRGSLSAEEVCTAMAEGIALVSGDIEIVALPMADGGEGTLEILRAYTHGSTHLAHVSDPLGRGIEAPFGLSGDGQVAFIEMAKASGLSLLKKQEQNPLHTSTLGTGQLVREALQKDVSEIVLGIGGSATNDAGMGLAVALGYEFLDKNGKTLIPNGQNLSAIANIKSPSQNITKNVKISVACDVANPLFGSNGAAHIFAAQKGASAQEILLLDEGLQNIARIVKQDLGKDFAQIPGAGAAGGLGFGLMTFADAQLKAGVHLLMDFMDFDQHLPNTNLILTGEGKFDAQTLGGKLIKGICDKATQHQIPVAVLCGTLDVSPQDLRLMGISYAASVLPRPMTLKEALTHAHRYVCEASYNLVNFYRIVAKY
jgi:glycerate kinase